MSVFLRDTTQQTSDLRAVCLLPERICFGLIPLVKAPLFWSHLRSYLFFTRDVVLGTARSSDSLHSVYLFQLEVLGVIS